MLDTQEGSLSGTNWLERTILSSNQPLFEYKANNEWQQQPPPEEQPPAAKTTATEAKTRNFIIGLCQAFVIKQGFRGSDLLSLTFNSV